MFSIDIVASAPDDPNVQNVFHIRKYGMQYTPAGPIFFGGNIYIYSRRVGIILQNCIYVYCPAKKSALPGAIALHISVYE